MIRELIQLAWHTIRDRQRSTPDPPIEHPGEDQQFSQWLRDRNLQDQADEDETRWTP